MLTRVAAFVQYKCFLQIFDGLPVLVVRVLQLPIQHQISYRRATEDEGRYAYMMLRGML